MLKRILGWLALAYAIYYLATDPQGAAAVVTGALHWVKDAGHALSEFLTHIH